jgi:hypothetical protein
LTAPGPTGALAPYSATGALTAEANVNWWSLLLVNSPPHNYASMRLLRQVGPTPPEFLKVLD